MLITAAIQAPYYLNEPRPTARLHALLQRLMWRNTKATVDLALPEMHEVVHTLDFTQVEAFLYRQHQGKLADEMNALLQRKQRSEPVTGSPLLSLTSH